MGKAKNGNQRNRSKRVHSEGASSRKRVKQGLTKTCNRCHEVKNVAEFYSDRSRHDGLSSKCKECESELRRLRYEKLKNRPAKEIPRISSKRCSKCGEVKPVADFCPALRNTDGYSDWCKSCYRKRGRAYHKKLAARRPEEIQRVKTKRCPKCGETKRVAEFCKCIGKLDGYKTVCRDCESKRAVTYRMKVADIEFSDIQIRGEKACWICHRSLPKEEFNYCRSNCDGLASHCRECGKRYKQEHYEENYGDLYNYNKEYRRHYPERWRAFRAVAEAVKRGELIRPNTCSKCGKSDCIVAHHDDYGRPLEIVWLCLSCDRQLHADLRRGR